jgi:hypothetical protein
VRTSSLIRRAFGLCAAAAILASCGQSQNQGGVLSTTAPGAILRAASDSLRSPSNQGRAAAGKRKSGIDPAAAAGRTLLYAAGDVSSYVFTTDGKVVGNITQTAIGACSDKNGDVFFTGVNSIIEFAHGGTTPIASYAVPGTANSCSIDPTTGNLAAVVFCLTGCGESVVVLTTPGMQVQSYLDSALPSLLFCTYDTNGNLYVDGYSGSQFGLAELPAGGSALQTITLSQNIQYAGQIQWDGQYIAVTTTIHPAIEQVQVTGSTGSVVGTTQLTGVGTRATQSALYRDKVAVPTGTKSRARSTNILFWKYPVGGYPVRTFTGFIGKGHAEITGVAFSLPPKTSR